MRATFTPTGVKRGLAPTRPVLKKVQWAQDYGHYMLHTQKMVAHDLTHVAPPGVANPREKYFWRRWYTLLMSSNMRFFRRDNIFPEEIPVVFRAPVPGGHGDRFTHSWNRNPGPNFEERQALKEWELRHLTPEQLAVKYGVYVKPHDIGCLTLGYLMMLIWMTANLIFFYGDDHMVFLFHPTFSDFVRELGGVDPITDHDAALEQWTHPLHHVVAKRQGTQHWSWKPYTVEDSLGLGQESAQMHA